MRVCAETDCGKVKESNQDRYVVDKRSGGELLVAVSDGMGGEAGGEIAAETAVEAMRTFQVPDASSEVIAEALVETARATGEAILRRGEREPALEYMGATLTGAYIRAGWCSWVHAGDSRLYLLRGGTMEQITKDHRFVQEFIDSGEMTEEEAAEHPMAHVLDQCLGTPEVAPDGGAFPLGSGDILLICSDGLTDELRPAEVREVLTAENDPCAAVDTLIRQALERGGRDNVTVVVVSVD